MNIHFQKILRFSHGIYIQGKLWFFEQPKKYQIAIALGFFLIIFFILRLILGGGVETTDTLKVEREVRLASVSSLSNIEGNFPLIGTVTSVSEATIRSEGGGRLTRVYRSLGDTVFAGGVIAEFDNSAERASVLQAEGAYEQAKASRAIAALNSGQAGSTLGDTKTQALNTISTAYTTMDDAIRGKTDMAYSDPKFSQVRFNLSVPDASLVISLENKRRSIETTLQAREAKNRTLTTSSDLAGELSLVLLEAQLVKGYLDDLFAAYSKALPDATFTSGQLDSGKSNVQTARQSTNGTISSIIAARTSLSSSITANQVAGGQTTLATGALASADAQVKQALGAYNGALSRLEKTIIRSPITGTLNSLSVSTGDYIGAFTQVAVVSNNGALEVISFVNEDDAKRITVGSSVLINNTIQGVVTRIASAVDPLTKKIEVRVGIKDAKSTLINGQSVSITITKNKKDSVRNPNTPIMIPLSALKLTPRGANVFVVDASSTLVALRVQEGAIMGEQIQILQGLEGNEDIVVDARGLKEGQVVTVGSN